MARYRKPTMKETIATLAERARHERERAEKLWEMLRKVRAYKADLPTKLVNEIEATINETVECGCGAHASMWDGEHWKLCERCMST